MGKKELEEFIKMLVECHMVLFTMPVLTPVDDEFSDCKAKVYYLDRK